MVRGGYILKIGPERFPEVSHVREREAKDYSRILAWLSKMVLPSTDAKCWEWGRLGGG